MTQALLPETLPGGWRKLRLKHCVDRIADRAVAVDGVRFLGLESIESGSGRLVPDANEQTQTDALQFQRFDVLFGKLRPYLAKAWLAEFDGRCSSELLVLRPRSLAPEFLRYWVLSRDFVEAVDRSTYGTKMPRAEWDFIGNLPTPVPPIPQQRAIAAFLDRETARIDTLIAKKERLLELLDEKRTALIAQAVTKGVDPTVPMKDSGVEWLGDVPAHWEVVPSTWLFRESKQRALDGDEQLSATQKYGVIPQAEFERLEGRQVVHAFLHLDLRKHVEVDDFVMSMRSFEGGLERVRARGCVRSSYVALKRSRDIHVGYFSYLFKSTSYLQALRATASFIRDGQDLNFENFRLVRLPLVRVTEQETIAAFLDRETARISALAGRVGDAIALLREYRTALISAAVTGQIDVSGSPQRQRGNKSSQHHKK